MAMSTTGTAATTTATGGRSASTDSSVCSSVRSALLERTTSFLKAHKADLEQGWSKDTNAVAANLAIELRSVAAPLLSSLLSEYDVKVVVQCVILDQRGQGVHFVGKMHCFESILDRVQISAESDKHLCFVNAFWLKLEIEEQDSQ